MIPTSVTTARIAGEAIALLIVIKLGLRVTSFQRVWSGVQRIDVRRTHSNSTPEEVLFIVTRAARIVPGENACLIKALCGKVLLNRSGYDATVRIGVQTGPDTDNTEDDDAIDTSIRAHAWLEDSDGEPIGERMDLSQYEPLPPLERVS